MNRIALSRRGTIVLLGTFLALGVAARFMPHAWNFTPVAAIALAVSAYLGVRYSIVLVVAIMLIADLALGFYAWPIMLAVYGSFAGSALLGVLLRNKRTFLSVTAASTASSLLFFIVTNLAVWQFSGMYPHTMSGLTACFIAALPFYRGTFLGDLAFTGFFFGTCELVARFFRQTETSRAL